MTPKARLPIESRTLDNGLRVVVSSTPGQGLVGVNLWYDVGSRHEEPNRQGFAHLFEHLMFQGSRNVEPGEHFARVQAVGGSLNASTSFDRTNYYEVVPRGALAMALWLEADRMAHLDDVLTQENFATQVSVVGAERSQRMDNVPYGTALEQLLPLVFDPDHPYGHLPIGNMQHLAAATLAEVAAFHQRYYMPNNAVLTIVGDVEAAEGFAAAETYLGAVTPGDAPKQELADPLPPVGISQRLDVTQDVPAPAVWFGARLPADAARSRELAAVDLAISILGEGETSRLHRRLVREDEIALSAGMGANPLVAGNSLGVTSVRAVPGQDLGLVGDTVREVVRGLADRGPTEKELTIAHAQAERDWLDELATAGGRADALSRCTLLYDDPHAVADRLGVLVSIDAGEIQLATREWLLPMLDVELRITPEATP